VQEPLTQPGYVDRASAFSRGGLSQGVGSQVGSNTWQGGAYNERSFSSTAEPVGEPSPAAGAFSQGRAFSPRGMGGATGPSAYGSGQCGASATGPAAGTTYTSMSAFGDRQRQPQAGSLNGGVAQAPPQHTTTQAQSWQRDPARQAAWGVAVQEPAAEPTPQRTHYDFQSRGPALGQPPWGASKERPQEGYVSRSEWNPAMGQPQPPDHFGGQAQQRQEQELQLPDNCIEVTLSKANTPGARFGFANVQSADSRSLLVTWVDNSGLLGAWNAQNPDNVAREGDAIINVNGVYGDSEVMRDKLQGDAVRMVVQPSSQSKGAPRLTRA